jgi:hypothetical protein
MWRRVPCEQLLNTGQSILRLRGSLDQTCGVSQNNHLFSSRSDAERESGPYSGTWQRNRFGSSICRGNATRPGDAGRSSGKSCLFCISRRGP